MNIILIKVYNTIDQSEYIIKLQPGMQMGSDRIVANNMDLKRGTKHRNGTFYFDVNNFVALVPDQGGF